MGIYLVNLFIKSRKYDEMLQSYFNLKIVSSDALTFNATNKINLEKVTIIEKTEEKYKASNNNNSITINCLKSSNKINKEEGFKKIKSQKVLKIIFRYISNIKAMRMLRYNIKLQNKINITLEDYKQYNQIIIEIIVNKLLNGNKTYFINYPKELNSFFHIYFDKIGNEIKRNYFTKNDQFEKIVIVIDNEVKSFYSLFEGSVCIKEIKFVKYNRKDINNMNCMFYKCSQMTNLDITQLKTDKVETMRLMFGYCSSLTSLDLSKFNTSNVTDMASMFSNCSSLNKLDLSTFDTHEVTTMDYMFSGCISLPELDLSNFQTDKVESMNWMFQNCKSLKQLDISSFKTNKVESIDYMFSGCKKLSKLNISNFITDKVTSMKYTFNECWSLTSLDLANFRMNEVVDLEGMFEKCTNLKILNISLSNTENVKNTSSMFYRCQSLISLDISNFDLSNVDNMSYMFSEVSNKLEESIKKQNQDILNIAFARKNYYYY